MKMPSDHIDLGAELEALRPTPRTEFTAELDARLAAGFARGDRDRMRGVGRLALSLRGVSLRRLLLPAGAAALAAIAIATVLIAVGQEGPKPSPRQIAARNNKPPHDANEFSKTPRVISPAAGSRPGESTLPGGAASAKSGSVAGFEYSAAPPISQAASASLQRDVQRGAELVLRTEPSEVDASAQEAFAAVHAAHGIVLSSSIHGGTGRGHDGAGEPSASFNLLVPTARLSDILASLSRIADVSSRHESTLDITAPTVSADERLGDAEARVDSLLAQLAGAENEAERATVEVELRSARRQAAALRSHLERLRQRAHFAHVSLRIESGNATESSSGPWGVDDAFGDAGRILSTATGVTVIGLAVIAPLALIALLAWLANRAWLRRRRERILG
jgi:hypothetical protein